MTGTVGVIALAIGVILLIISILNFQIKGILIGDHAGFLAYKAIA